MAGISYSTQLQGKYADLVDKFFERANIALDESQAGSYTADRFVADSVASWLDMTSAWLQPVEFLGLTGGPRLYVIEFSIKSTTPGPVVDSIKIPLHAVVPVECTDVTDTGGNIIIPAAKIVAALAATGRSLTVTLQNLGGALRQGSGRGSVAPQAGGPDIAHVIVNVA